MNNKAVFERCPANNVASLKLRVLLHIRNNNSKRKLTAMNRMLISPAKEKQAYENTDGVSSAGLKYFFKKIASLTSVK